MFYIPCYKYVFAASMGMVESKCHIDSVANGENLPKGSANDTGINACIRNVRLSRIFEAQGSRKHYL
jgi:hypothetical protein